MYLNRELFIWTEQREKLKITGIKGITPSKVEKITEEVIYWRKANAIHNWFVKNIQEGNDDCGTYYVSKENLENLLKIVKKVLINPILADQLLPTHEGFFFGGAEYDKWYFQDLEKTETELTKILKNWNDEWEYHYHSSW
jgi:hypothetical protein